MRPYLLLAVIGMAGCAGGQVVEGPHKMFRNTFHETAVFPFPTDSKGKLIVPIDLGAMRRISGCPDYMWIVADGRFSGYYCILRPPWPAEDIRLPIPEALRRKP